MILVTGATGNAGGGAVNGLLELATASRYVPRRRHKLTQIG